MVVVVVVVLAIITRQSIVKYYFINKITFVRRYIYINLCIDAHDKFDR